MSIPVEYIRTETRNTKTINDEFKNDRLIIDRSFQRRYVWVPKDKVRLIETILLGYTIPEVYFWEIGTEPTTGETKYSVVDGQQRLGALNDFLSNNFVLSEKLLDYNDVSYKNKSFDELTDDEKKKIWNYPFSVRFINEKVNKEDIVTMFDRLNSTSYALTPQELRNAKFNGLFHSLSLELAEEKFWDEHSFFSGNQGRRMVDVEFMSQILIYFRFGLEEDIKQENINKAYKLYDEEYKELEQDKNEFLSLIDNLKSIINLSDKDKKVMRFLKKTTHLYSILILFSQIKAKNIAVSEILLQKLIKFIKAYEDDSAKTLCSKEESALIDNYKEVSQEGTKSRQGRIERVKILKKFLEI